mgnify:CR=1 FL=1
MPDISMTGVGSGIDWSKIIQYELNSYREHHVKPLKNWKDTWTDKLSVFSDLNAKLDELQSACDAIDRPTELRSYNANVSDEGILKASASAAANPGTYEVEVNQLANAEIEMHSGLYAAETPVNNSGADRTFSYGYGGETVEVNVPHGTTLRGLADLINNDSDNPGVTASILDDGSGATSAHHLRLRGNDTGSSYGITINSTGNDLTGEWSTLSADAISGMTSVTVDDASPFRQYQAVLIDDDDSSAEYHIVDSINTNTLNLRASLGDDFTVASNAYTTPRGTGSAATSGGAAGTNEIAVDDASHFHTGQNVVVADAGASEKLTVSSVDLTNNVLTFESNLVNDYATDAYVTQLQGGRRFSFEPSEFTEVQTAQNAQIRVDGYPSSDWIERETNSADDIIEGVSLNLQTTTAGSPVTVTVSEDRGTVKDKIRGFVDAYNAVRTFLNEKTRYDAATDTSGLLLGNYGATLAESQLRNAVVTPPPGFRDATDTYTLLGEIGVESLGLSDDKTTLGTLSVDEDRLEEALGDDFDGVVDLFAADFAGESNSDYLSFTDCSEELTTPGTYDVEVDFDAAGNITGARMKLSSEDTYREASINGDHVVGKSGHPEEALWVHAEWDGSSATQSALVRVKQGLAGEVNTLVEEMQNSSEGLLTNIQGNYTDIVSHIETKIADQEARLDRMEARLSQKYARLERTLAQLQSTQSWTSSISKNLA